MGDQNQKGAKWLSDDDFTSLFTVHNQFEDGEDYTVSKEDMRRLAEIGVVQSHGFGRYSITSFGDFVIGVHFSQTQTLPLRTIKDFNEEQAIVMRSKTGAKPQ